MNNFTFGDEGMGYYETIAGGAGAGPGWHGRRCGRPTEPAGSAYMRSGTAARHHACAAHPHSAPPLHTLRAQHRSGMHTHITAAHLTDSGVSD